MKNWKRGQLLLAVERDEVGSGEKIIVGKQYTFSNYVHQGRTCTCDICGSSFTHLVMLVETGDCEWSPCTFGEIDTIQHHSKKTIRNQSVLKKLSRLPHLVPERIEEGVEHA